MVSISEAEKLVLAQVGRLPAERCKLKEAAGRILRQEVRADRDGPPFDRATLDGVCLRHADWAAGRREFAIAGMQAAGAPPLAAPPEGACLEIATGAPVPAPCDCVLRLEDFERDGEVARARTDAKLEVGTGIHARGTDYRSGAVLLEPGRRLTGREIAIAAACGCTGLDVTVQPRIAVLTTGDELVDIEDEPKPHQVRRSNDLAIRASLAAGVSAQIELNHLPDSRQAVSWNLERLLQQADVIVVTGGASVGRFDFVPAVLKDLGVAEQVAGVSQRPGRPMWFGTFQRAGDFLHADDTRVVAVFALPGNPVSSFTCLHRYVLPALAAMNGVALPEARPHAVLAAPLRGPRTLALLLPVQATPAPDGRLLAVARPTNTSGDLASLAGTDGFVEIEAGTEDLAPGAAVPFFAWH